MKKMNYTLSLIMMFLSGFTQNILLSNDVLIQPNGNHTVLFDAMSLEKGYSYLITIHGVMKPDYSSHVWGCQENTVERNFNCDLGIIDPFNHIEKVIQTTHLDNYSCGPIAAHPEFLSSCSGKLQFNLSFTIDSLKKDKVYQVYFRNDHSVVKYHHSCAKENPEGGFEFPILIKQETSLKIVKVKN